ncbi:MAG: hypothetical protein GC183_01400 [Thiobacillus sp.]|nr:hypothetical protein [Thiobacillus sp.]
MNSNQLVFIGAANWTHPAWTGGFYPDDLPEDWLLSYYNTRFHAVYLPEPVWRTVAEATWTEWLNDTHAGFVFVLEPGGTETTEPASERVLLAPPAWMAEHVWWLDEQPDLRALAQRISQHAVTREPLFAFSRSGNLALMEAADTLRQVMGY